MIVRRGPRLSLEELAPHLLTVPAGLSDQPSAPFAWQEVFDNDRAVELEIGFGKGLFLLTAAAACPGVNFVGVEIVRKYQLFTATRLAKRGLSNVRVACADVGHFLPLCASSSLQAVHVYFPDPWWKKRHHKRRVFTADFVRACTRVLKAGGILHAVTDVEEYAAMMVALLAEQSGLHPLPPPETRQPSHDLDYLTNFERKFRKQSKPIYRMRYERSEVVS